MSAVHQHEHAPPEVFALVPGVPDGCRSEFRTHFVGELVVSVGVEPASGVEPLSRDVPIPAVLVGKDHLDDITAQSPELFEQFWQRERCLAVRDDEGRHDAGG